MFPLKKKKEKKGLWVFVTKMVFLATFSLISQLDFSGILEFVFLEFQIAQYLIIHKFTQGLAALSGSRTSVTEQRGIRCGACPPHSRGRKAREEGRTERKAGATECFAAGPLGIETSEQTSLFFWVKQWEFTWKGCFPQVGTREGGMKGWEAISYQRRIKS